MDVLLAFGLPGAMFLALELLWCRRAGLDPPAGLPGEWARRKATLEISAWDPLALPFVRRRLEIIGEEMERLATDESIYGRAFRYGVAKTAYTALLDDAIRLAAASRVVPVTAGETMGTAVSEAATTGTTPIKATDGASESWAPSYEVLEV